MKQILNDFKNTYVIDDDTKTIQYIILSTDTSPDEINEIIKDSLESYEDIDQAIEDVSYNLPADCHIFKLL